MKKPKIKKAAVEYKPDKGTKGSTKVKTRKPVAAMPDNGQSRSKKARDKRLEKETL